NGNFSTTMLASRLHGVRSAYLDLINFDLRDADRPPLLTFDLARLAASKIDWAGDAVSIEEISLKNLIGNATIDSAGRTHAFGLVMTQQAPTTQLAPTTAPADEAPASAKPLPLMVLNTL